MRASGRKWALGIATPVIGVVVLAAVLWLLRVPLLGAGIEWLLGRQGFPYASVRVESVGLYGAVISDLALVPELGPTVDRIDVRYRASRLVQGRLDAVVIRGLRMKLDLTGQGPLLGKLEPLVEAADTEEGRTGAKRGGNGFAAAIALLPPLRVQDTHIVLLTSEGPAEARLDGAVDVAEVSGEVDGHFTLTLQSAVASADGSLDVTRQADGTLYGAVTLDRAKVDLPQARVAGLHGWARVRQALAAPDGGPAAADASLELRFDELGFGATALGRGSLEAKLEDSQGQAHARVDGSDGAHVLRIDASADDALGAPAIELTADASIRHDSALWHFISDLTPNKLAATVGTVSLAGKIAGSLASPAQFPTSLESATALFSEGGWSGSGQVELKRVSVATDTLTVEGLDGVVRLSSLAPPSTPPGQVLHARRIDAGVPLDDVNARFRVGQAKSGGLLVHVEKLDAAMLGGRLAVSDAEIEPQADRNAIDLHLTGIDLGKLLERVDVKGLSGSGRLTGDLPVAIEAGKVAILDGRLTAVEGGHLSYRSDTAQQALASGGEQVNLMMRALRNFQYDDLSTGLDMDRSGYLRLSLAMAGHNPEVLEGYPFRFNVNLEGDATPFLDALTSGSQISGSLLKGKWKLKP